MNPDQYSIDVAESKLQETRDDLNRQGYKEHKTKEALLMLEPGEYSITPRFSESQFAIQLSDTQGERLFSVCVRRK